jgi:hypothetical protein
MVSLRKQMQLQQISFVDSTTFDYWMPKADLPTKRCKVAVARGEVVFEDDEQVTLGILSDKDGECCSTIVAIPKVSIIERKPICDDYYRRPQVQARVNKKNQ